MPIDRVILGKRGSAYALWVSKQNINVNTALPGHFLLDTNSTIHQVLASGDTFMTRNTGAGATYTQNIPLQAELASYSRLLVWANRYLIRYDSGFGYAGEWGDTDTSSHGVLITNGVLTLKLYAPDALGGPATWLDFWIRWVVFRERY
jgi:hypothetical protein